MHLIHIAVECYAGYKADEYPKSFTWKNHQFIIEEIVDRWYQGDVDPDLTSTDYFKVITTCKKQFILKHKTDTDAWYLVEPYE